MRPNRQPELFQDVKEEKINLPREARERARGLLVELMIAAAWGTEKAVESEDFRNG